MESPTASPGTDRVPRLLERERELRAIEEALGEARRGTGSVLLVEGPAGIGKTRLLEEVERRALDADFLVRRARGGEMEREMSFGVARQLFEAMIERASEAQRSEWLSGNARQSLVALGYDDASRTQGVDAFTAINGLYWLVANAAEGRPLALIFDDAHWSDSDSLRFVSFLTRRLSDIPVLVALGARTGEPDEPAELAALRLESSLLRPQPLSEGSVHVLIEHRAGESPTIEFSRACASVTAGNPFLVVEILRELGSGRSLDSSAIEALGDAAPQNVARSVLFRLGRFGDEAIALARAIAVLGHAPQLRHAAQLAGISSDQAVSVCDRLRNAEILAPGTPIDFVHPLVRQAIYGERSEEGRSADHRRAAAVLFDAGAAPLEIASHLLVCSPNGDQWVVQRLHDAARKTMSEGGHKSAVGYLERALEEPPEDPAPILVSLGEAMIEADPFRAPQVLAQAVDATTDQDLRVAALRHLVWTNLSIGNLVAAADGCDRAIEAARDDDRELVLALEAQRYFLRSAALGLDRDTSTRLVAVAENLTGQTPGECVARQALSMERFLKCAPIDEVVALARDFPDPPWEISGSPSPVPFAGGKILAWSGRWTEARSGFAPWLENAHREAGPRAVSVGNSFLSEIERLSGNLIEAEALARTAWEVAESAGRFSSVGWSAWMNLAAVLLARGDLDGFTELIGEFDLSQGPLDVPLNPFPLEIRAHLRVAQGDLESAADDFLALGHTLEDRVGWLNPAYPRWRQEATEVLAALGRGSEAERLIAVAEERGLAFGCPQTMASILRARAFLEPRTRAIRTLERSAALFEEHGPPHELARSLIELGASIRRAGRRSEAREPLQRALELAHDTGAVGLEQRSREELAAVGSRPRRIRRTGVAALTATESKIARLASEGLNNREIAERLFVTRRTVETHLTHAYQKLGIEGRDELFRVLTA